MSFGLIFFLSAATVACAITFALRLASWSWLLRHAWLVDVSFTAGLFVLLNGTLGGALIAALSGLLLSMVLTAGRYAQRYQGYRIKIKWKGFRNA